MDCDPFNFFFLLILVFPFSSSLAQTNGRIPAGTSLTATQNSTPWLSPSSDFAFGFQFLPQNGLFLLSIWYYKLPERTIVWYANDGNLVPNGSTLALNAQNGLVLTDPQGNLLWSALSTPSTIEYGILNDTGNFVLFGPDSSAVWQSFDDPTDTLLPTQTMGINGELNSRISDTNFSKGRFQLRLLEDGKVVLNPREVLSNFAYDPYLTINTEDSSNSSNGRQLVLSAMGQLFIVRGNGERNNLTDPMVTSSPKNYYYRATLNFDGVFVMYRHPKESNGEQNWTAIWTQPGNICLSPFGSIGSGACGYNSICNLDDNRRPVCHCPPGYSLLDPNDKYGSCKPSFVQSCDESGPGKDLYTLDELNNINWPFNDYERISPINEEGCRNSCLSDCFCAVAIHNSANDCWKKRLPLSNGRIDAGIAGTKFLMKFKKGGFHPKDPDSSDRIPGPRRKQGTLILVVSLLLGSSVLVNFVFLGVCFSSFFHIYKKKIAKPMVGKNSFVETNLRNFSYEDLVQATNGFKDELGRGSFGLVYKGVLDIGGTRSNVAVKKLHRFVQDGEKEFQAEVNAIAHTHHKNLVRLLGFCDDGENRLLVYEYMRYGSLASFLFGDTKLSWNLRTRIALGIARGLLYLHEECTTQIIHCDIKPQNILLDDFYNARISDFGISKLLKVNQSRTQTAIRGTKGYVAPEWFRNTPVTIKVDVYSFGVQLLEIISCRKTFECFTVGAMEGEILIDWVWDCFQEGKLEHLVENDVEALNNMKIVERFVMVGIWCIQEDPFLRPNMRRLVKCLKVMLQFFPLHVHFHFLLLRWGPNNSTYYALRPLRVLCLLCNKEMLMPM